MSVQEERLKAIADAIREKDGTTDPIPSNDFPARIRAIETGMIPDNLHYIHLESIDEQDGTVSGSGLVASGVSAAAVAVPAEGCNFIAWKENEEIVSTDARYIFPVGQDRTLIAEFVYNSRLPRGYTEVEYIQIGYLARVPSGISVTNLTTRVVMDITPVDTSTAQRIIFGAVGSLGSGTSVLLLQKEASTGKITYWAGTETFSGSSFVSAGKVTTTYTLTNNSRITIDMDVPNKSLTLGTRKITLSPAAYNYSAGELYLSSYTAHTGTVISNVYSAQVYIEGALKGDFVPCTNEDGTPGFFNLVDMTFHPASSGTLTPGPAI